MEPPNQKQVHRLAKQHGSRGLVLRNRLPPASPPRPESAPAMPAAPPGPESTVHRRRLTFGSAVPTAMPAPARVPGFAARFRMPIGPPPNQKLLHHRAKASGRRVLGRILQGKRQLLAQGDASPELRRKIRRRLVFPDPLPAEPGAQKAATPPQRPEPGHEGPEGPEANSL